MMRRLPMVLVGDEVVYDGENEERRGQPAKVSALGAGYMIEIEFATEDATGHRFMPTLLGSVTVVGERRSMELPSYRPGELADDGRTTDVDTPR
jgi:hypothetical protein